MRRLAIAERAERVSALQRYLLILLLFLLPVQFSTTFGPRLAPADFVVILMLIAGALSMRTSSRDWSLWHAAILGVLSLGLLTSLFRYGSVTRWALLNKYVGIIMLLLLFLVLVQCSRSFQQIWTTARLLLFSVILQAAVALPLYFVGLVVPALHVARIEGLMADPNAYGGLLVVGLALHWSTVGYQCRLISRRWGWVVTGLLLVNLLFSFSRSSWIGLAFVVCAMLILNPRCWAHIVVPAVTVPVVAVLFFRSFLLDTIVPLMLRPEQVSQRVSILDKAVAAFLEHPVFGIGLGAYLQQNGVQVHNTLFWFLAEMGVVGAVAFIGFVCVFLVRGVRALKSEPPAFRPLTVGLLVAHIAMLGLSLGIEAFYQRDWWVIMALLGANYSATLRQLRSDGAAVQMRPSKVSVDVNV